jgi:anthranilate/para-aminobenzoate synthase component I
MDNAPARLYQLYQLYQLYCSLKERGPVPYRYFVDLGNIAILVFL